MRQALGDRAGEAAAFYQLGVLAHRLSRTRPGARLAAVCWMIDKAIGHGDADSDLRAFAGLCSAAGLDQGQMKALLAEVDESYRADGGRALIEQAFERNEDDSGPATAGGSTPRSPRGPGLLRRLWGSRRPGAGPRAG